MSQYFGQMFIEGLLCAYGSHSLNQIVSMISSTCSILTDLAHTGAQKRCAGYQISIPYARVKLGLKEESIEMLSGSPEIVWVGRGEIVLSKEEEELVLKEAG